MVNIKATSKYGFYVDWIGRSDSPYENATLVQFRNKEFEDIINNNKIDFHYELHINQDCAFVRLDCHCHQYSQYKNIDDEEYIRAVGKDRFEIRNKLADKFKISFPEYKLHKYTYNYLALIKKDLNMGSDILPQIISFIDETYEKSIIIIKSTLF